MRAKKERQENQAYQKHQGRQGREAVIRDRIRRVCAENEALADLFDLFAERGGEEWASILYSDVSPEERYFRALSKVTEIASGMSIEEAQEIASKISGYQPLEGVMRLISVAETLGQTIEAPLIRGFLCSGTACLAGKYGSLKSLASLSVGLAVAAGLTEWFGMPITKNGPVIYLNAEGNNAIPVRMAAAAEALGIDLTNDIPFYRFPNGLQLMHVAGQAERFRRFSSDHAKLYQLIEKTLGGEQPALVMVDTVASFMPGGVENTAEDMQAFVRGCQLIQARYNCTVLAVHHLGKGGSTRGSSALNGGFDQIFVLDAVKVGSKTDPTEGEVVRVMRATTSHTDGKSKDSDDLEVWLEAVRVVPRKPDGTPFTDTTGTIVDTLAVRNASEESVKLYKKRSRRGRKQEDADDDVVLVEGLPQKEEVEPEPMRLMRAVAQKAGGKDLKPAAIYGPLAEDPTNQFDKDKARRVFNWYKSRLFDRNEAGNYDLKE